MKDGIIDEGKSETNLLKKNLSSAQVTDPRTTRTMSYVAYDMNHMIWSGGKRIPFKVKNDHLNEQLIQKERETKQILSTYEGWRSKIAMTD